MRESVVEEKNYLTVSEIVYPLVVVLTQDCDLAQDYQFQCSATPKGSQDKIPMSCLVTPPYSADHVFNGERLSQVDLRMRLINRKKIEGKFLKTYRGYRYHFWAFPGTFPTVDSVVDFKHLFSVNLNCLRKLREAHFVGRLEKLYREDLSHRFAAYLSRIGLPEEESCLPIAPRRWSRFFGPVGG